MKTTVEYYRNPTPWEIKFGEGAIHYLTVNAEDFPESVKKDGTFKKWFISRYDNLRYYY